MCGIVGAIAERHVEQILLEGLKRLEYRGYDSAGLAVIDNQQQLQIRRAVGKVAELEAQLNQNPVHGRIGIAHTRWATHGKPTEYNAHPHQSTQIALVHNGIIENHTQLKNRLQSLGHEFISDTDTEVLAHLINQALTETDDLLNAVQSSIAQCTGAYALAVINSKSPEEMIVTRHGSPLVIGLGIGENFIASDQLALRQVTDRFIYLEEGDIARVQRDSIQIIDGDGKPVNRIEQRMLENDDSPSRGQYRHFMLKEIYEQPSVIGRTLAGRLSDHAVFDNSFGVDAHSIFDDVEYIHIVACGTSYHAGMVGKYWMESLAGIACSVEIASEFRYRTVVVPKNCLLVLLSQSGETADTLAALKKAKQSQRYLSLLSICNVANSSLVRESNLVFMTQAGPEIGVASTKAFSTQLVALHLLTMALGKRHNVTPEQQATMVNDLKNLPNYCEQVLQLDKQIERLSEQFVDKEHALFLGRGIQYPIAMEGALKLKEISYIHAEAYPAGELKHGPLALVDEDMPVIAVAPNDELIDKLKSNLQEVHARNGQLIVFSGTETEFQSSQGFQVIPLPHVPKQLAAIVYTLPLQLLAYHVAVFKGTDVDQPRNLAKSVTVE